MTRYLVLYRSPVSAQAQMADASPDQAQAGMDAWMAWAGTAGPALTDLGAPLAPAGTVGGSGSGDDPVAGYSMMEADSQEALHRLLAGHPHLTMDGAVIEAHELLSLPGA